MCLVILNTTPFKHILTYSSPSQTIPANFSIFQQTLAYSSHLQHIPDFFSLFHHICLNDMMLILGSVRRLAPAVLPADILGRQSCRIRGETLNQKYGAHHISNIVFADILGSLFYWSFSITNNKNNGIFPN